MSLFIALELHNRVKFYMKGDTYLFSYTCLHLDASLILYNYIKYARTATDMNGKLPHKMFLKLDLNLEPFCLLSDKMGEQSGLVIKYSFITKFIPLWSL